MQDRSQLTHVHMQTADGCVYPIKFGICLNSTGAEAQEIARLAGIGMGEDALSFDLPIMSRFLNYLYYLQKSYLFLLGRAVSAKCNIADVSCPFIRLSMLLI